MTDPLARFSLDGRVAVVTGAASGLGLAIAIGFSEAGARVVAADLAGADFTRLKSAFDPPRIAVTSVDVTDRDSVEALAEVAFGIDGRIDALVNSAGVGGRCAAEDYPAEMFERNFAVNLAGTFNCCQAIGRRMLHAGRGSIINMASIVGLVGFPGSVGYQASKGGVVQLTKSLAVEWALRGVRVNAIAPSQFDTPLTRQMWEQEPGMRETYESRTPNGRSGQPDEIVGPAIFLASDAASMVTGHILLVDGGFVAQ